MIQKQHTSVTSPNLANGLSGMALTLARFGREQCAQECMEIAIDLSSSFEWKKNGLFWGRSGVIAAAAVLQEVCKSSETAARSIVSLIDEELDQTERHSFGKGISLLGEKDGSRLLPYLSDGNAGLLLGLALASDSTHIDYNLDNNTVSDLAVEMETPFTIDISLANGGLGMAVVLEYMHRRQDSWSDLVPLPNWNRCKKYILPFSEGLGFLNPRTLNYDFSYSKGVAGLIATLSWIDDDKPLNLMGLMLSANEK